MSIEVEIYSKDVLDKKGSFHFVAEIPSICPHCNFALTPKIVNSYYYFEKGQYKIFAICFCGNCKKFYLVEYSRHKKDNRDIYKLVAVYPQSQHKAIHTDEISELSPNFVKIYDEAYIAEQSNLYEICGMGYRKAAEFLIKDFAIKLHPDDEDKIKTTTFSQCIKNYIDNKRIKALAIASAWIGNDETHYYRKHEDYTLESMKLFLNAMVNFIDSELQAIKAQELIQV